MTLFVHLTSEHARFQRRLEIQRSRHLPRHLVVFGVASAAVVAVSFDSTLIPIGVARHREGCRARPRCRICRGSRRRTPSRSPRRWWPSAASAIAPAGAVSSSSGSLCSSPGARCRHRDDLHSGSRRPHVAGTRARRVFPSSLGMVLAAWPAHQSRRPSPVWTASAAWPAPSAPRSGRRSSTVVGWRGAFLVHLVIGVPALFGARECSSRPNATAGARCPTWSDRSRRVVLGPMALVLAQARVRGACPTIASWCRWP